MAADQVQLAVLVNSFNRLELLRCAIQSLQDNLNLRELSPVIMVFDAGSDDGSREYLHELASDSLAALPIELVDGRAYSDRSLSAGTNCLSKSAIARFQNLRYLFLFETDNYLKRGEILLQATQILDSEAQIGAVGFTVVRMDGQPTGFGRQFPRAAEFIFGQTASGLLRLDGCPKPTKLFSEGETIYADVVYTSPILVKCTAWLSVGGFDSANFPFSDCDLDLCYRLRNRGWRVAALKTDAVVHDNRGVASKWSERRTVQFHQARLRLLETHRGTRFWMLCPLLLIRHIAELICLLPSGCVRRDYSRLKTRLSLILRLPRKYANPE